MKKYDMDGIYFRIKHKNKYENICFLNLKNETREKV